MTFLDCAGRRLELARPAVMGVLNATPDSFSDGGLFFPRGRAIRRIEEMVAEGADIIDVGGESTRPGALPVSIQEELDRVIPVIEAVRDVVPVPISIDTAKPEVMHAAVAAGAGMINDVYALRAEGAVEAAVELGVPVCLMHRQGEPRTMQKNPVYTDVVSEVREFLARRRQVCIDAGIDPTRIIVDPGFGFGKTLEHNLSLLHNLDAFTDLSATLLVGLSRKSMIGAILDAPVERRLYGSLAAALLAIQKGAGIVRVHDVRATRDVIRMYEAVSGSA